MYEHHRRAIERVTAHFKDDPLYLALLLGGSIAKGRAKEDSDVDFVLIATDAEFKRRQANEDYWYLNQEDADWPGGYIEGKIVDRQFLREVAERGSEPARAAFQHVIVQFSRWPELETILKEIVVYPEAQRGDKIRSFYSQLMLLTWYIGEAEKRNDRYLLLHTAADLVLYGGRLILAHNRILYPYHKWFMYELHNAPDKPDKLLELADDLLANPSLARAEAFRDCIVNYQDWGITYSEAVVQFMKDSEWNWRSGPTPLEDS